LVENGGSLITGADDPTSARLAVAWNSTSGGSSLTVTGTGSSVTVGQNLVVGNDAAGTMTVSDNASVVVAAGTTVGEGSSLTITGASLTTTSVDVASGGSLSLGTDGILTSANTTITSGATLTGAGSISGSTTVAGTLGIGNSTGPMTFENLSLTSGSVFAYELAGGTAAADLGLVGESLDLGGAILDLVQLGTFTMGDKFTLFSYDTISGTFDGLGQGDSFAGAGGLWNINYFDDTAGQNGGTGDNFVTITAIPEPAAVLLGGLGLLALLRRRR
jgi:T5SS/PEP-CTERM-associated repeat protein